MFNIMQLRNERSRSRLHLRFQGPRAVFSMTALHRTGQDSSHRLNDTGSLSFQPVPLGIALTLFTYKRSLPKNFEEKT